jgi:quercetin dioxygenase-like cupin family protein
MNRSALPSTLVTANPVAASKLGIMFVQRVSSFAKFTPERMGKSTIVQGGFLFAGLNSFEPGQEHAPHAHDGQDKLYLILEGSGMVQVGDQTERLSAGDAAFAPSGIVHSIRNPGPERLVVMAVLGPPPLK